VLVLVALALLVSGVAATSGRQPEQIVSGASFHSAIDARWRVVAHTARRGFETMALSSTGAHLDAEGIPPAGAIGITITDGPASAIAARPRERAEAHAQPAPLARTGALAEAAVALMGEVVRTPASAQGIEVSGPARYRTLAGASAAEESYEYVYRGRGNVQLDVVAARAGEIYFIELDTELAQLPQGEAAFARLLRNWSWR
jgi:hypothetical protein